MNFQNVMYILYLLVTGLIGIKYLVKGTNPREIFHCIQYITTQSTKPTRVVLY